MPYIYKIVNDINNKIYVGKTRRTIEQRWREHLLERNRIDDKNRPIYKAMSKYGIEHFHIEIIEEISVQDEQLLNEREKYWIEYLNSYKDGYNATFGGDGQGYADYEIIYKLYMNKKTFKEISQITGYGTDTISRAVQSYGITQNEIKERVNQHNRKPVAQLDKNTEEILKVYPSCREALKEMTGNENITSGGHIGMVCKGTRKTAYGYKWKYL